MLVEFKEKYDKLFKLVASHDTSPEDEPWFFKEVQKLLKTYGDEIAIQFAKSENWPEYTFELLVKSGLKEIPKDILLPYLQTDNEDNFYCIAFSLAACGYQEGFDLLKQFVNQTHPLSKNIHPITDILPDLNYIEDARIEEIKQLCKT
jgi:hypothetical protein